MTRYRQEVIRQSNCLLLQLAGLRIEQEKWRDAPVVRGPGGKFASPQGLSNEQKRQAKESGLLKTPEKLSDNIGSNTNIIANKIGQQAFDSKGNSLQRKLSKAFAEPNGFKPARNLEQATQNLQIAYQQAEKVTTRQAVAQNLRSIIDNAIDVATKALEGVKHPQKAIKEVKNKLTSSQQELQAEKGIGKVTALLEENHLDTNKIQKAVEEQLGNQSDTIDQDLKDQGVDSNKRKLIGVAIGVGVAILGAAAITKYGDDIVRIAEKDDIFNAFKQIGRGSDNAAEVAVRQAITAGKQAVYDSYRDTMKPLKAALKDNPLWMYPSSDVPGLMKADVDKIVKELAEPDFLKGYTSPEYVGKLASDSDIAVIQLQNKIDSLGGKDIEDMFAQTRTALVENTNAVVNKADSPQARKALESYQKELVANISEGIDSVQKYRGQSQKVLLDGINDIRTKASVTSRQQARINDVLDQVKRESKQAQPDPEKLDKLIRNVEELKQDGNSKQVDDVTDYLKQIKQDWADKIEKNAEAVLEQNRQQQARQLQISPLDKKLNEIIDSSESKEVVEKAIAEAKKRSKKLSRKPVPTPATEFKSMNASLDQYGQGSAYFTSSIKGADGKYIPVNMIVTKEMATEDAVASAISFTVNNQMNIESVKNIPQEERNKLAIKLAKTFEAFVSRQEDGRIFKCIPYDKDAHGGTRAAIYKIMGFSSSDLSSSEMMYGVVKNGRLYPALADGTIIQ